MNDRLLDTILEYLKLINPYKYKDITIKLDKKSGVCVIIIHTESQKDVYPYVTRKNGITPLNNYITEMGEMFPYDFVFNLDYK